MTNILTNKMQRTAEFINYGHPDRTCDQIATRILDELLTQDPSSRVAAEITGGHGIVFVTGEITSKGYIDINQIVHNITGRDEGVVLNIVEQSPEIAAGVEGKTGFGHNEIGAGDIGISIGAAFSDTKTYMPYEYEIARQICKLISSKIESEIDTKDSSYQDGKVQVTINENKEIETIAINWCHRKAVQLKDDFKDFITKFSENNSIFFEPVRLSCEFKEYYNAAGDWETGSFIADAGTTSRKIGTDTYSTRGYTNNGSGLNGKDPSKTDFNGAIYGRWIALQELETSPEIDYVRIILGWEIGVPYPVSINGEYIFKDGKLEEKRLDDKYTLHVKDIIEKFELKTPNHEKQWKWGRFGNQNHPWES